MVEDISSKPMINFGNLRRFNAVMFALHLIQAVLMLWLGLTLTKIAQFKLPFTVSFLKYDESLKALVTDTRNIGSLQIGVFVSVFLFISALAHFLVVLPKINDFYNSRLLKNTNYFRWFEYSLSSSVMIVIIAMLFGVYDLGSLILIVGCNATMNLLGLMMEIHNQTTEKTNWSAFIIGSIVGIFPWIIILMYFLGGGNYSQIPWFVYAIVASYFVLFNLFPINMVLQYKKIGRWKDYLYGERGYIILSLVAKSLLAWLVFAGTMQPN
ncbi:MAG: heliorhodopsin HeR [Candidatus Humimicrobiaceae bacterium]